MAERTAQHGVIRRSPLAEARSGASAYPSGAQFPTTPGSARRTVGDAGVVQGNAVASVGPTAAASTQQLANEAKAGNKDSADLLRLGGMGLGIGAGLATASALRNRNTSSPSPLARISPPRSVLPLPAPVDYPAIASPAAIEGQYLPLQETRRALPYNPNNGQPTINSSMHRPSASSFVNHPDNAKGMDHLMDTLSPEELTALQRNPSKLAEVLKMLARAKR